MNEPTKTELTAPKPTDGAQPVAAPQPPEYQAPPIPRVVLKARDRLGLPKKLWDAAALKAIQEFGHFLSIPITAKIVMIRDFDSLEQCQNAINYCSNILSDRNTTTQQKLDAVEIQTLAIQAQIRLSQQIMDASEKAGIKPQSEKPRNLPPQIPGSAIQINVNGGRSTEVVSMPATSAAQDEPSL